METYAMFYSLESGSVKFAGKESEIDFIKDQKSLCNPILDDDLYLEIFFTATEESLVKDAFLENLEHFSHASYLTRKFCKNPLNCDYSEKEEELIREASLHALNKFKEKLGL